MGLFKLLADVVTLPVRVAVDVVKLPVDVMNGDNVLQNTTKGIKKIEEDMDE
jgi:hypothetical protein